MKKYLSAILAVAMLLSLAACGGALEEPNNSVYQADVQEYITEILDETAEISAFEKKSSDINGDSLLVVCIATYAGDAGEEKGEFTLTYVKNGNKWKLDKCRVDLEQKDTDTIIESTGNTESPTEQTIAVEDLKFAFVTRIKNPYSEKITAGFKKACEDIGVTYSVETLQEDLSTDEQEKIIKELITQGVDGIAVAPVDALALKTVLEDAKKQGISVVAVETDADGAQLFINPLGVTEVARTMLDAVYDITGGEGQFAVMSGAPSAVLQNAWVEEMTRLMNDDQKYSALDWVDTVYCNDVSNQAIDETQNLLENNPELKGICCITTVGIWGSASVVASNGANVKVTGLGLASEMKDFVGEGKPCPYVYFKNPEQLGETATYALLASMDGSTTCTVGETFTAKDGNTYTVFEENLYVGWYSPQITTPLLKLTQENIEQWANVF